LLVVGPLLVVVGFFVVLEGPAVTVLVTVTMTAVELLLVEVLTVDVDFLVEETNVVVLVTYKPSICFY